MMLEIHIKKVLFYSLLSASGLQGMHCDFVAEVGMMPPNDSKELASESMGKLLWDKDAREVLRNSVEQLRQRAYYAEYDLERATACVELMKIYYFGLGVKKDGQEAARFGKIARGILDRQEETLKFFNITTQLVALENKDELSKNGVSDLIEGVGKDNMQLVKILLARGVEIDGVENGWTPLFIAVQLRNFEIAKLLLTVGANPNKVQEKSGKTPLQSAAARDYPLFELLLKHGATANWHDNQQHSVLYYTITGFLYDRENYQMLPLLLQRKEYFMTLLLSKPQDVSHEKFQWMRTVFLLLRHYGIPKDLVRLLACNYLREDVGNALSYMVLQAFYKGLENTFLLLPAQLQDLLITHCYNLFLLDIEKALLNRDLESSVAIQTLQRIKEDYGENTKATISSLLFGENLKRARRVD